MKPVSADAIPGSGLGGLLAPGRRAALLIVPSIFGNDAGTIGLAESFAGRGFAVGLPTLFGRGDAGPCGFDEAGKARAFARMRAFDREQGLADLTGWCARLRAAGNGKLVVLGICFGGHLAVLLNAAGEVDGVVTVHGGGLEKTLGQAASMKAPMSLHFGGDDGSTPPEAIAQVRAAFAGRGDVQIAVHPGAVHGFAHPGSPAFQQAASDASMAALDAMLSSLG